MSRQPSDPAAVLTVRGLGVQYTSASSVTQVVDGVDLALHRNRTMALVGESGSGKTTVARAIMGLVRPPVGNVSGEVVFKDRNLLAMSRGQLSSVRGREIGMIFQEPMRSLNPAFTVGDQIAEVVRAHGDVSRREAMKRAVEAMRRVRIPRADILARRYPYEFSGGMCQRVMIAMAIVMRPSVLIADEPTTALDVTVQAQVLDLLKELQSEMGLAMLFITHDLGVVADVADDVTVMYAGQVVESGGAESVFFRPRQPYSAGLLASIPDELDEHGHFRYIPGAVPSSSVRPIGCRFAMRCPYRLAACEEAPVPLEPFESGEVRCIRAADLELEGTLR
jgi:peptide/nickel transport system ATP-binding protein